MESTQHRTYINQKITVVYKIRITAGLTRIGEVAALFSHTHTDNIQIK